MTPPASADDHAGVDGRKSARTAHVQPDEGVERRFDTTLTEAIQAGYSFDAGTCLDGDSKIDGADRANRSAAFTVKHGRDMDCTFNNTLNTANGQGPEDGRWW